MIANATLATTALHVAIGVSPPQCGCICFFYNMSFKLFDMLQLGPAQGGGCSNINQTLGWIQQPPLSISLGQVPPSLLGGEISHDGHDPEKLCHGEWFSKSGV